MKKPAAAPKADRQSARERRARLVALVTAAESNGEKVPRGVKLIGFRAPTAGEKAFAKTLEPIARECRVRRKAAA